MVLFLYRKWFLPFCLQVARLHFGSSVTRMEIDIFAFEPQWRLKCFNFLYRCDALFAPPTVFTRLLATFSLMASSAKKRAVGLGENPEDSDNTSDDNLEEDDDSGEEDSEGSEEDINEVNTQGN